MTIPEHKRVAVLCDNTHICGQELIEGISAYLSSTRVPWLVLLPSDFHHDLARVDNMQLDGMIADFDFPPMREAAERQMLGSHSAPAMPVVGVGSSFAAEADYPAGISYVATDDFALVKAAYDHLIEVGLTQFALLSVADVVFARWALMRENAFRALMQRDHLATEIYRGSVDPQQSWDEATAQLTEWVRGLPKPIGIIVVADRRAKQLLQACLVAGIAVPEEVAVIGIDNNPMCRPLTRIALSSVVQGSVQMGQTAAHLLHQRLSGVRHVERVLIPPQGLQIFASSQHEPIKDAYVRRGRHFIRQYACQGIKTQQVADYVGVSRCSLDTHFIRELGYSVHEEILRFKLDAAKSMLATDLCTMSELAIHCGFTSVHYLYKVFRRELGCTPREFQERGQQALAQPLVANSV